MHEGSTTVVAVALGTKGLCVAGLAVDLSVVLGEGGAVETLLAGNAAEAHLVPVAAGTQNALGKVDGLSATRTLGAHRFKSCLEIFRKFEFNLLKLRVKRCKKIS